MIIAPSARSFTPGIAAHPTWVEFYVRRLVCVLPIIGGIVGLKIASPH